MRSELAYLYLYNDETRDFDVFVGTGKGITEHVILVANYARATTEAEENYWFSSAYEANELLLLLTQQADNN